MYLLSVYLSSFAVLSSTVAGLPTTQEAGTVSYDGYKAYRINVTDDLQEVKPLLSSLSYDQWTFNARDHLDISISGDQLTTFESLGLDCKVTHEDLGASISVETRGIEGGIGASISAEALGVE